MPRAGDKPSSKRPVARRTQLAPGAILVWIIVWQLGSMALDSTLLLPSPLAVAQRLVELLPQGAFWARIGFSLARILAGFALGALLGGLGALAAARWRVAEELIAPLITLAKSVPVASITVLALIWLRAANLAVFVVLLVVLPVVYENALQGIRAAEPALAEAAQLFGISPLRRLRFFVMPTLYPYLQSALALGLGTAWKAGVAAEVIGIPAGSLGEAIYDAKVYFDTAELFAVTLAIVAASALSTALLRAMLEAVRSVLCGCAGHADTFECTEAEREKRDGAIGTAEAAPSARADDAPAISNSARSSLKINDTEDYACLAPSLQVDGISKAFDGCMMLNDVSFTVHPGTPLCLMAPSGAGKTTLLRIIAGLEQADAGTLTCGETFGDSDPSDSTAGGSRVLPPTSMMFQDNRLAGQVSALANVRLPLARGSREWAEAPALLAALGLSNRLHSPAGTCSGGEQRRIALARALLVPHGILLLDEPFTGLDGDTKTQAAALIRRCERDALVIVATHDECDVALLDAQVIRWA